MRANIRRIASVIGLLMASAPVAEAQRAVVPNGGFGGGLSHEGVDFHYQYVYPNNFGSARDVRTLVLVRGQPYWNVTEWPQRDAGDDTNAVNHLRDSLSAAGWRVAFGMVTGHWLPIAYDSSWQHLWLPMGTFDIPSDSTLVVMIDRADHIGGPPRIAHAVRIGQGRVNSWLYANKGVSLGPDLETGLLDSAAASSPVIKEFIDAMVWRSCPPPDKVFVDFQTDKPAQYIPDKSSALVPSAIHDQPGIDDRVVQFVVDSAGRVEVSTLMSLWSAQITDAVRAAAHTWRFRPAVAGGCAVRSLLQVLVVPR